MPTLSHTLFLEQAIRKFVMPEHNLDELKAHLRSERGKD